MRKVLIPIAIIVGILVLLGVMLVPSYNKFVTLEENVDQSYAQVENQLQRRMDLIPNLVNTVKGFANMRKKLSETFQMHVQESAGAQGPEEQAAANDELSGALAGCSSLWKQYPDLKANENFRQLMDELAGTENRIGVARQDYNTEVATFNKRVKRFPGNLTASIFGFDEKEYFKADEAAKEVPKVDFGDDKE